MCPFRTQKRKENKMSYTIKKIPCNRANYGTKRDVNNIKHLVYHYTGNKGDRAESNGNYFKNNRVMASAHYFVDDNEIIQSVEDCYIAWAVGGRKYPNCIATGGGMFYGVATNSNTIHIEMCGDRNGVASAKTQENAIELGKKLMKKYSIQLTNIIRHFDVTGKECPAYFCCTKENNKKWEEFKVRLAGGDKIENSKKKKDNKKVADKGNEEYKVKIVVDTLNIRNGAGTSHSVTNKVGKGEVYTIVKEKNGWGRLKSGAGWICLAYTKRL